MPTLLAGKTKPAGKTKRNHDREGVAGVTLIEMLVVVALISLMVGISYPALTSGIESLRLNGATNGVVSFLDYGLSRAERRQQMVEITISKADNSLEMRSSEPGFYRKLEMPEGVSIVQVLPPLPENADPDLKRSFLLYPGGTVPPLGLQLINRRNVQRVVRVDPITGVPRVEAPPQ
jgi:prepilin-type N-terminal cleavage/methylation domain-containing protein